MNNVYYERVEIKGESDLPKTDDIYWVHCKESNLISPFSFHNNSDVWLENIDWYLQPVSTPETIVGPTEEMIKKNAKEYDRSAYCSHTSGEDASYHFTAGAKWYRSQLKTVNLKDELTIIRNKLHDNLPTGEISAFDLITIIKLHLKELDFFIDYLSGKGKEGKSENNS